jgi:Rab3 GTPase-activating protein catalytic subunit
MTEDMLDQNASLLLDLGSTNDASLLRAKIQSASLLSDMESFKAANPGCILEDFIRWYSPRDLIQIEELSDHSKNENSEQEAGDEKKTIKFELSPRMKIPGNIWVDVWSQAKPVAARRQRRLFDDTKEAEKVRKN